MKLKLISTAIVAVLLANFAVFAKPDTRKGKTKKQTDRVVTMLPASDAVASLDMKAIVGTALSQVLSTDQAMLSKITSHIDAIKERTGIDVRQFDRVAVGVSYKQVSATETDYATVIIATASDLNLGGVIGSNLGGRGGLRTETIAGKKVAIFTVDASKLPAGTKAGSMADKLSQMEIAAVSIDRSTVAIGTLDRVRETLEGKSRLSSDLTSLLAAQSPAMVSFAMRTPANLRRLIPFESDELGKTIDSMRFIAGTMDVNASGGTLHLVGRTASAGDALNLKDTLEVGQSFGKIAFAGKKRPDQLVYSRLINSARIDNKGIDVTIDASIPKADIDVLMSTLKK